MKRFSKRAVRITALFCVNCRKQVQAFIDKEWIAYYHLGKNDIRMAGMLVVNREVTLELAVQTVQSGMVCGMIKAPEAVKKGLQELR